MNLSSMREGGKSKNIFPALTRASILRAKGRKGKGSGVKWREEIKRWTRRIRRGKKEKRKGEKRVKKRDGKEKKSRVNKGET